LLVFKTKTKPEIKKKKQVFFFNLFLKNKNLNFYNEIFKFFKMEFFILKNYKTKITKREEANFQFSKKKKKKITNGS
jgi:hypothetical protein